MRKRILHKIDNEPNWLVIFIAAPLITGVVGFVLLMLVPTLFGNILDYMAFLDCWRSENGEIVGLAPCPCDMVRSAAAAGYYVSGGGCSDDPAVYADVLGAYYPPLPEGTPKPMIATMLAGQTFPTVVP